ncbi:MFS transporter [Actinoallomurus rhizosphaericola]|uniref:MFS transporter n=1 Tax=Actinoallomurus rhizosphaericola TaxID=2952536 RepID=UPI002092B244|nr:MFS transporter [Actinoallomurus rhizosphaericola]MCO5997143.1 MFS transporter [Actinoallomurus rhizosphaericola]
MTDSASARGGGVLIGALVVDSVGNGLFLPLSLVFFTRLTDVPLGLLGVLLSVANAITLPVPVWAGALADRLGALPLVVAAQLMQALGYLAYTRVDEPVGIFLAAALVAIGVRFFWSSIFTAVADYADAAASGRTPDSWFAWANMARTAGLGVGGLITGAVMADGHASAYRGVAYGAAGCFAAAAAAIAVFVRAPRLHRGAGRAGTGYGTILRDRPFLALTGVNTVLAMTSMMLALATPTFVITGLRGPSWLASALLVGNFVLVSVLAAPVVERLAGHRRTRVLVTAAALWALWCFLLSGLVPGRPALMIPVLIGATLLFTLAEVMHAPVSMALATAISPAELRGRYMAAFQYSFTVAGIIAPAFFTRLFGVHRALPWVALGAIDCLAAVAVRLLEPSLTAAARRVTAAHAAQSAESPRR